MLYGDVAASPSAEDDAESAERLLLAPACGVCSRGSEFRSDAALVVRQPSSRPSAIKPNLLAGSLGGVSSWHLFCLMRSQKLT